MSLTVAGSLIEAEFGNESAAGNGVPEFELIQGIASGSTALVALQPVGKVGGVTASKFSVNTAVGLEHGVAVGASGTPGPESMRSAFKKHEHPNRKRIETVRKSSVRFIFC